MCMDINHYLPLALLPVCPENETWNSCGNPCYERLCNETSTEPKRCTKNCVAGCYCNEGYKRDPEGRCINCTSYI